ncbi:MAG: hypothetical protein R2761_16075 [Acidimicrobiales bacterium]
MTPRTEELHMLSLDQSCLLDQHAATAVCSCGAEHTVIGKNRTAQWAAAYDWHAEHKLTVNP